MLSICIPTYNHNIDALVSEVINQCEGLSIAYNIQVANDGSTLTESDVINSNLVTHSAVSYHYSQTNSGRTETRNFLAQRATYDWLLFLDADVQLPSKNFISSYVDAISEDYKIIFGGVSYQDYRPDVEYILRWKYGRARETKSALERIKNPHFIISQNLLVQRETFLNLNDINENRYGLDNYFSAQIKKQEIPILHIDNPVIHLGLEKNRKFLTKGIQGAETLAYLERANKIDADLTPLQCAYTSLERKYSLPLFRAFIKFCMPQIEKNLSGSNPSLKLYDIYRLYHYALAKKNEST